MAKLKLTCTAYSPTKHTLLHTSLIIRNHFSLLKQKKAAAEAAPAKGSKMNSSSQAHVQHWAGINNDAALLSIIAGRCIFSCSQYFSPNKLYKWQCILKQMKLKNTEASSAVK